MCFRKFRDSGVNQGMRVSALMLLINIGGEYSLR